MHVVRYICSAMGLLFIMTTGKAAQLSCHTYQPHEWVMSKHVTTDRLEKIVIAGREYFHIVVDETGCFLSPKEDLVFRRLYALQDRNPSRNYADVSRHRYTGALFNAKDGSLVKTFTPIELDLFNQGGTCVWNQQGTFIAEYKGNSLRIWNVKTGRISTLECNGTVEGLIWCPNGRYVVAIGGQRITFIDALTLNITHTQNGNYAPYKIFPDDLFIRWNPSGTLVCFKNFNGEKKTYVYRVKDPRFELVTQIDNVRSFEWIDNFRLAALVYDSSLKGRLRIIDMEKSSAPEREAVRKICDENSIRDPFSIIKEYLDFDKEFEISDSCQCDYAICLQKIGTTLFWTEDIPFEKKKVMKFDVYRDQKPIDFIMRGDSDESDTSLFFVLNNTLLIHDEEAHQLCFYDLQDGHKLKVIKSPFNDRGSYKIKISPDKNYAVWYDLYSQQSAVVVDCRTYGRYLASLKKFSPHIITPRWTSSGKLILSFWNESGAFEMAVFEPQTDELLNSQMVKRPIASPSPAALQAPGAPREPFVGGVWNWMRRHRKPLHLLGCVVLLAAVGYWGIKYRAYLKNKH